MEDDESRAIEQPHRGAVDLNEFVERLFREVGKEMFRVALRALRNKQDAEDLVQECFLRIVRSFASAPAEPDKVRPWAFTILRNALIDQLRARGRQRGLFVTGAEVPIDAASKGPLPDADTRLERLLRFLESISPELAITLCSRVIGGESNEEIAASLGIPLGTAASRLRRAPRIFAERILADEHDNASSGMSEGDQDDPRK